ncbi:MAG: glycosyltransferase family 2 protein [Leptospiraceae bacterium]|nr:glycosyltransferase family 2 protein [Leptospiraceae bacterium]MCP5503322.1 glycosyltransferase family 2 protein [Leptospiraceae bacterium]
MNPEIKVSILLSTYNSERYLKEQLSSIINQTYADWNLLIRDDGSTDSTLEIIKSFNELRFKVLEVGPNLGTIRSFSRLLELDTDSDYFFFCDHDDIWNEKKVEYQLLEMIKIEKEKGSDYPILIHSDLTLVDENNTIIADSMWSYGKFFPHRKSVPQLIVQGTVTGCTIIGNRALHSKIFPIPNTVLMHDWWASIIASLFGCIISENKTTIFYRLHSTNQIGTQKSSILQTWNRITKPDKFIKYFYGTFMQAEEVYNRFQINLNKQQKEIFLVYINLLDYSRFKRIYLALKYGFVRSTYYRNILYYIVLFFASKKKLDERRDYLKSQGK